MNRKVWGTVLALGRVFGAACRNASEKATDAAAAAADVRKAVTPNN
jgi:hypothetical protein